MKGVTFCKMDMTKFHPLLILLAPLKKTTTTTTTTAPVGVFQDIYRTYWINKLHSSLKIPWDIIT